MTAATIEPIRKRITVECPQERAFRVFVEHSEVWWPKEHHLLQSPLKSIVIEPRLEGRWYEVAEDGSECSWGKVLAWEPPRRVVLAWQINAQWQYDASFVTEVEVLFTPEGPKRTRVELEHRSLGRYGDAAEATRGQLEPGWAVTLDLYRAVVERA
jgi:uncharacterized protein YndB with AHSA1/START domain